MATLIDRENSQCKQIMPMLTEEGMKKLKSTKPKMDHAKEAMRLEKIFKKNGIEIHCVGDIW